MRGIYLLALIISLAGLGFIDYRLRLALFKHPRRTIKILLIGVALFVVWDIAGIASHIFFIGQNNYLLGLRIGQFPLEELFFLTLLNYTSLVIYLFLKQRQGKV